MSDTTQPYRVLARKYRPVNFDELVGQDVLVQTLSNAITLDRIAHAFLLTGIRGIGKTTTARIIARALNCIGPDGSGGPTTAPCGECEHCVSIAEDRHIDVMEMDAASRTGVNDIRELIENVPYKPTSARYKIYIIDEVHMLSNSAFNALLKTLEEPPPHVKFIFATTEIRKIPVTVLSRCQRFDLKRIEHEKLAQHLGSICEKESIDAEPAALAMVARAAEGSVRDALSLLDQAIAHSSGKVTAEQVQNMVGMADRSRLFDLFDYLMAGNVNEALNLARAIYHEGGDPQLLLQDLLDVTWFMTRMNQAPEQLKEDISLPELDRQRGSEMAANLSIPVLGRCWQMMLKGLQELKQAPNALQALEMIFIRLAHSSTLPTPDMVLRQSTPSDAPSAPVTPSLFNAPAPSAPVASSGGAATAQAIQQASAQPAHEPTQALCPSPQDFPALVTLFEQQQEPLLASVLHSQIRLVRFARGTLELLPASDHLPDQFAQRISRSLQAWTGERWMVSLVTDAPNAQPTLEQQAEAAFDAKKAELEVHPRITDIRRYFPEAEILSITPNPKEPQA